jgi:hypothetical protein
MGYNIEISFNILKHSNVTELQNNIVNLANECLCSSYYHNYECENYVKHIRTHSVTTLNFDSSELNNLIKFLKNIKHTKGLYIENIYDEDSSVIVYASRYYINKMITKEYNKNRSYSEEEKKILNSIGKSL